MAERRRGRKRREADEAVEDDISQKRELEIAKYLRSKVPTKKTTLLGHKVDYFIASKAIDCLLDSKWATNEKGEEPLFTTRESVVEYMQRMLVHQYFHRAQPIPVRKKDTKRTEDPTESSAAEDTRDKKKDRVKKDKKDKTDKETEKEKNKSRESSKEEKVEKVEKDDKKDTEKDNKDKKDDKEPKEKVKKEGKDGERKKEKPRFKLDMHLEQVFVDGNNPYVWIYEPTPVQSWVIGILVLIAATAICLFPLWPRYLRNFVYYLSIAGAGFLLFVFSLVILRCVIFVIIWLLTFGKHNFWILPNLTEDVGVLESFWPLYQYEYKGGKKNEKDDSKEEDGGDKKDKKKQKKQKSEDEQSDEGQKAKGRNGSNQTDDDYEETEEDLSEKGTEEEEQGDNKNSENAPLLEDEDASSNPIKSNNGDADNGFEILDVQESSETS